MFKKHRYLKCIEVWYTSKINWFVQLKNEDAIYLQNHKKVHIFKSIKKLFQGCKMKKTIKIAYSYPFQLRSFEFYCFLKSSDT